MRSVSSERGARGRSRAVLVGIAAAALALGLALLLHPRPALGAVSVFLLGVVVASALGGALAGIVASIACFLSLSYFFTEPQNTLRVARTEDLVALVVFLLVALIVGSLVSRLLDERARAVRSEQEARLLSYFATKVLSGEPPDAQLRDLAASLVESLRLSRCEIHASIGERSFDAREVRSSKDERPASVVVLTIGGEEVGSLLAARDSAHEALDAADARLLEDAARQVTIALERAIKDEQIGRARTEAEVSEVRAALFSSVTHDLRTPLSSIKAGVTSLLQDETRFDAQQRHELLTTVLEETERLNRLLGNLLDLARVRAGALTPAKEPTALDEIVESVLHRLRRRLSGVHVRTILRDVPDVLADPVQLDQVLTNLLDNAVRFSPVGGEVTVSVAPWRSTVELRVADQGPGIQPDDRERVFEAFYRGDGSERPGSGLGLAIARAIVQAHGGQILIEGAPGGGTVVVVRLPVAGGSVGDPSR